MVHIPRSRTTSLARSSPSRLIVPPALKPSPSLSNLNIHSHNPGPSQPDPAPSSLARSNVLDSSASSVISVDMNEGILIQDMDADVEPTDDTAVLAQFDANQSEEGPKKHLRDQLRRTLTSKALQSDIIASRARQKEISVDLHDTVFEAVSRYPPREYFILTDAGKPVFISRPGATDQDNMASTVGVMQALISVFLDDGDKLRCINAGRTRITFLLRSPLYYVCASSWGEPESVTRAHLEYLHLQILSIVTATQLRRIFERRTNFDLRRLLHGAEPFMYSLLDRLEGDLAMTTASLHCLKLDSILRRRIADTLVPHSKIKDILYVILIAKDKVVTLIRPRKHSIHPADLHIILNTLNSPSILNSPASASWIPFCLPKFNPSGFVNAFIAFLRKDDIGAQGAHNTPPHDKTFSTEHLENGAESPSGSNGLNEADVALVCITGGGDFEAIRGWCETVITRLKEEGTLHALVDAFESRETEYSVSELGIPGLRHFVYKSRAQVQVTLPLYEDPYDSTQERRRLVTLYQTLHDAIHARSGQEGPLKLQYIRTDTESVMGWITQPFELYIALSPRLPKSAAVGAANAVARWVKKEESRLFLQNAPVF